MLRDAKVACLARALARRDGVPEEAVDEGLAALTRACLVDPGPPGYTPEAP